MDNPRENVTSIRLLLHVLFCFNFPFTFVDT